MRFFSPTDDAFAKDLPQLERQRMGDRLF